MHRQRAKHTSVRLDSIAKRADVWLKGTGRRCHSATLAISMYKLGNAHRCHLEGNVTAVKEIYLTFEMLLSDTRRTQIVKPTPERVWGRLRRAALGLPFCLAIA